MNTIISKKPELNRATFFKGLGEPKPPSPPAGISTEPMIRRVCANCATPATDDRARFCVQCGSGPNAWTTAITQRALVKALSAAGSKACQDVGISDDEFFRIAAGGSYDNMSPAVRQLVCDVLGIKT